MIPRLLVLPGSARPGSAAARLAGEATRLLAVTDVALSNANLADYPLPIFEPGPDEGGGAPENAHLLAQRLALQDGLLLVAPAVHAGIAPLLVNAIDWIAGAAAAPPRPVEPFRRLVVALASTGREPDGGRAGLVPLRAVLQHLGAEIVTAELHLVDAPAAFDADGRLADPALRQHLDDLLDTLLDHTRALGRQS